jgi:hypothetical protein
VDTADENPREAAPLPVGGRQRPSYLLPLMGAIFAVINVMAIAVVVLSPGEMLGVVVLGGVVISEMAALSIVTVLSGGPWFSRWLTAIAIEAGLVSIIIALSFAKSAGGWELVDSMWRVLSFVPIASICVKLPLLPLRYLFGYQLSLPDDEPLEALPNRQFRIADLFGMLTLTALAIGLMKAGGAGSIDADWVDIAATALVASFLLGAFIALPCAWVGLVASNKVIGSTLTWGIAFSIFLIAVALAPPIGTILFCAGFLALLTFGGLYFVRMFGYEVRRRSRPTGPIASAVIGD